MDLLVVLFLGTVFLCSAALFGMIYLSLTESRFAERWTVRKRLLYMSAGGKLGKEKLALYKKDSLKNAGIWERIAFSLPRIRSLDRMLIKTGMPLNASTFLVASIALGGIGFLAADRITNLPGTISIALLCLSLPYLLLKYTERKALAKFQDQLPEALDFLARALRSGHALTGGFEMVANEMDDPIKSEFAATVDETNLGLSFNEALENLCTRVPSRDLRFFAISIQIQRETGGNLAEILDNISHLIRERVKFSRHVKTLTAEGRVSAIILFLLPIALAAYLYVANYDYLSLLWLEPVGLYMLCSAIIAMIFGAIIMKKIVSIEM